VKNSTLVKLFAALVVVIVFAMAILNHQKSGSPETVKDTPSVVAARITPLSQNRRRERRSQMRRWA